VPEAHEVVQLTRAWLLVAAGAGVLLLGLRLTAPAGQRWLPPRRERAVPWSGREVLVVCFLCFLFWPTAVHAVLSNWLTGGRGVLWATVLSLPPSLATAVLVLRRLSDTRPYQVGLTGHRTGQGIALACLAFLTATPGIFAVHLTSQAVMTRWLHFEPEPHPLTRLFREPTSPLDWGLLLASAVVAAPVIEELLFRGVIQPWLARHPCAGGVAATFALAGGVFHRVRDDAPGRLAWDLLPPVLFVVVLAPGFFLLRSRGARGVYGTALLFAAFHSFAWPTPVPLFFLGLVLGWLARRTGSLVGPIVLHALFNAVACVLLLTQPVQGPANGKEQTIAGRRPPVASTSSSVPGASLPRRR
jgi:membrane protease YdiL (CAAX protease family)